MARSTLLDLLLDRVERSELSAQAGLLVLAAYEGSDELYQALEGAFRAERAQPSPAAAVEVPRTYLKSIGVAGFRGVGPESVLRLEAGPGLTLVVGRNGSGKSSFAEAAEVALTGANARWTGRLKVWREGWRNLHVSAPARVSVELVVDGEPGTTKVVRTWAGADVDSSSATGQRHGQPVQPVEALALTEPLRTYRPFLSYAELGQMLQGKQSELHDALFSILGLEALSSAQQRLREAQKALEEVAKASLAAQKVLVTDLAQVADTRASEIVKALTPKSPDLEAVERVLRTPTSARDDLAPLQDWSSLRVPDVAAAAALATALSQAHEQVRAESGTDSGQARRLVALLERALEHAEHTGSKDCPVCGAAGRLDGGWLDSTKKEITRLRTKAAAADAAETALRQAQAAVAASVPQAPAFLTNAPGGVDGAQLAATWRSWAEEVRSADVEVASRALRDSTPELAALVVRAVTAAREELAQREDVWQPFVERLAAWMVGAREAAASAQARADVKSAADWLKGQADALRNDRLAPVTEQAARIWQLLRQQSSVDLGPVRLEGTATQRRVTLDVTVDGVEGAALSVMSQGELHALSLSLFLPRAMLSESPFRFLVIDDPVQAMDPAKVDGLARVLAEVAVTHQVVVFTHDDRLPEAVRRLQLPATVWQVVRRERSVVELTKATDPVLRYLEDARALANSSELAVAVTGRVVPGLCRGAIEAACQEVYRRERLKDGRGHVEVEDALREAKTTTQLAALALFEDVARGGEVLGRLNSFGGWAADAFKVCKSGVHTSYAGDLKALVRDTERLAGKLRS